MKTYIDAVEEIRRPKKVNIFLVVFLYGLSLSMVFFAGGFFGYALTLALSYHV